MLSELCQRRALTRHKTSEARKERSFRASPVFGVVGERTRTLAVSHLPKPVDRNCPPNLAHRNPPVHILNEIKGAHAAKASFRYSKTSRAHPPDLLGGGHHPPLPLMHPRCSTARTVPTDAPPASAPRLPHTPRRTSIRRQPRSLPPCESDRTRERRMMH